MKKIMFMLGAVAMAAGVQAASINWSVSTISAFKDYNSTAFTQSGSPASVAGLTAYLIDTAYLTDITDALGKKTALTTSTAGVLGIDNTVTKYGVANAVASANMSLGNTYDVAILYVDARGDDWYYLTSSTFTGKAPYDETDAEAVQTSISAGKANVWDSGSGWTKASASSEVIPEPTSGLLMLVGLGALALRRRR